MWGVLGGSRLGASVSLSGLGVAILLLGVLAQGTACRRVPQLQHTLESPTAVAEAVVAALGRKDAPALERLAVSEDEFRQLVWPRQPAARPERNIPWDYAWKDLSMKSRGQLRARINEWPAAPAAAVVAVSFAGETTDYEHYKVFRKSQVTLRDPDGRMTTVRLFGSVIEQGGRYKVFSYVTDSD